MAQLDGKQLRNQSTSLDKLRGYSGLVTFTASATMSFAAGSVLRQADENISIGTDVVNKNYVDSVAAGLDPKESVKVISATGPVTLSGVGQTIDGYTVSTGDRILVNAQAGPGVATFSNGIYSATAGAWSRSTDSDGAPSFEVSHGNFVFVTDGTQYLHSGWVLTVTDASNPNNILVGTESQLWVQFSESTDIQAGDGLYEVGNTLHVLTGTGLTISSDAVVISNTGVVGASYGTTNSVAQFAVNSQGQLTAANNQLISIGSTQVFDFASASEATIFSNTNFVDGTTLDFTVVSGESVSGEVTLGSLTASRLNVINSASASQGWKLGYNTTGQFEWFDPTLSDISSINAGNGLTGGGVSGDVTLDVNAGNGLQIISDVVSLGGTLSQNTTIASETNDFTISNVGVFSVTASMVDIEVDNGIFLVDVGNFGSIDLYGGDTTIYATGSIDIISITNLNLNTATGSITTSNLQGLVYSADYGATFVTHSLVDKKYVDNQVAVLGSGTLVGVTAGTGLTGGGTGSYITLNVNLGENSGLTFSGDYVVVDSNIAGNGLDISNGVLTVNTSEITSALAGNGLTANGSTLDVNVNSDSLEIISDFIRLKDTITGDRTFQDSLTVGGNLIVNGTVSYINTENLLVEDNIITLNATYSGPYNIIDAGIEVNLGGGTYAALIWDSSESLWAIGFSGSTSTIISEAGVGLTKSGNNISVNFTDVAESLQGSGLSASAGVLNIIGGTGIGVDDNGVYVNFTDVAESLQGSGLSASAGVLNIIGGTGIGVDDNGVYVNFTDVASGLDGAGLISNGTELEVNTGLGLTVSSDTVAMVWGGTATGLTFSNNSVSVNVDGTTLFINSLGQLEATTQGDVQGITAGAGLTGGGSSGYLTLDVNLGLNSGLTFSGDDIIIDTTVSGNGLTFSSGVLSVNTANGLTINNDNVEVSETIAGQGLTFSSGVIDMVWGGTATGTTFSNDSVAVVVDGTTIQINNSGQLTVVSGVSIPVYDEYTAVSTTGDDQLITGVTASATPNDYSRIEVFVNGQKQRLGDGVATKDCYFGTAPGVAIALNTVVAGSQLYWNGTIAGFDLSSLDRIEIVYES